MIHEERSGAAVARRAHNPKVTGSNPVSASTPAASGALNRTGMTGSIPVRSTILALLMGCSVNTDPTALPPVVAQEWAIGQAAAVPYVGDDAYTVWPSMFNWAEVNGPLPSSTDTVIVNGEFDPLRRLITWNTRTPTVIRHEAGHAILWKLGHPDWRVCTDGHGR